MSIATKKSPEGPLCLVLWLFGFGAQFDLTCKNEINTLWMSFKMSFDRRNGSRRITRTCGGCSVSSFAFQFSEAS